MVIRGKIVEKRRRLRDVKKEQALKRQKAKRRKRVLFLISEIIVLAVLLAMAYILVKYGSFSILFNM